MREIQIKNLRGLIDTGRVQLPPLTLLVGRNSSGKSTFLRTFPLFRQSVAVPTRSPVLWFDDLVDFGDFTSALSRHARVPEITFGFGVRLAAYPSRRRNVDRSADAYCDAIADSIDVMISVALRGPSAASATSGEPHVCRIEMEIGGPTGDSVVIEADRDGAITTCRISGEEVRLPEQTRLLRGVGIIPSIGTHSSALRQARARGVTYRFMRYLREFHAPFEQELNNVLTPFVHASTQQKRRYHLVSDLRYCGSEAFLEHLRTAGSDLKYFVRQIEDLSPDDKRLAQSRRLLLARGLPEILLSIDEHLRSFFMGVRYQAPTRATALRYYRASGLAIDEVDFLGRNIAMYLRGLTDGETKKFAAWAKDRFGFSVSTSARTGHVSVMVRDTQSDSEFNLADVGFGYSQLLPLVMQLWAAGERPRQSSERPRVLAFEQPELHLHPHLQAQVGRAFAQFARARPDEPRNRVHLIAETHSEALVNAVGLEIAAGNLSPDDVQVLTFESVTTTDTNATDERRADRTSPSVARFDKKGYLLNWPYGFFQP